MEADGGLQIDAHYLDDRDELVFFLWRADQELLECVRMGCDDISSSEDLEELRDDIQGYCDLIRNWRFVDGAAEIEFHHRDVDTVFIDAFAKDPETDRARHTLCTVAPDVSIDEVRRFDFLFEADRIAANCDLFPSSEVVNGP